MHVCVWDMNVSANAHRSQRYWISLELGLLEAIDSLPMWVLGTGLCFERVSILITTKHLFSPLYVCAFLRLPFSLLNVF